MAILIDGYNLLHVTGVFSDAVGPGSVEKLHAALIDFLQEALDPSDIPQTTIVFDAKGRRAVSRRSRRHGEMTVHYAARDEDADTLLAELIQKHTAPRRLVVVSSDHQVQRAARRRRAKPIDSEVWYADLLRRRRGRHSATQASESRPTTVSPELDAAWWLAQFAPELLAEMNADAIRLVGNSLRCANPAAIQDSARTANPAGKSAQEPSVVPDPAPAAKEKLPAEEIDLDSLAQPFPPSYLEAIRREFLDP